MSGVPAEEVKGIGISGQMHGLVMLDEQGEVLPPSIIWCDQRTGEEVERYAADHAEGTVDPDHSESAVNWLDSSKDPLGQKAEPEIYARCRHIFTSETISVTY